MRYSLILINSLTLCIFVFNFTQNQNIEKRKIYFPKNVKENLCFCEGIVEGYIYNENRLIGIVKIIISFYHDLIYRYLEEVLSFKTKQNLILSQ